jgi:hypothetical protein
MADDTHQFEDDPVAGGAQVFPNLGGFAQAGDHHVDAPIALRSA